MADCECRRCDNDIRRNLQTGLINNGRQIAIEFLPDAMLQSPEYCISAMIIISSASVKAKITDSHFDSRRLSKYDFLSDTESPLPLEK